MATWNMIAIGCLVGIVAAGIAFIALTKAFGLRSAQEAQAARAAAEARREGLLSEFGTRVATALPQTSASRRTLSDKIAAAGIDMTVEQFRARCAIWAAIGAGIGLLLALLLRAGAFNLILSTALTAAIGAMLPRLQLSGAIRRKQREVETQLPGALEMLAASAGAGLSIERSIELVSERTDGTISREFGRIVSDIVKYGYTTSEAMRRFGARNPIPSVTMFVAAVTQALGQGSSIGDVLRGQAEIARNNHFQKLEEQANKIPVKMIVPLVLFILPGVLIVSLAPTFIQLAATIGSI